MQISKELYEKFDLYGKAVLTEDGSEILDDRKKAMPVGLKRPPSLLEQIRRLMRGPLAQEARENEMETFEEANNFDAEDPEEAELFSGYEIGPDDLPVTTSEIQPPDEPLPTDNKNGSEDLVSGDQESAQQPPEAKSAEGAAN